MTCVSNFGLIGLIVSGVLAFAPAQAEDSGKGIGPVKDLKLEASMNADVALKGKNIFVSKCSACHKMAERYVGPALNDVFKRRKPEWIANMILNPVEMTKSDPAAADLLAEYLTQMTLQNVTEDETKVLIEYFRYYSEKGEIADAAKSAPATKTKTKKK